MADPNPATTVTNPRIARLIEHEVKGDIKPEHQTELDTYRAQGLAPKKSSGNSLTEYQGKSTGFFERALGANAAFEAAGEGGSPVGYAGDIARAVLPSNVVNSNTSPERQKAQQAREDFIRASLRYESGAAINEGEFKGQDSIFFPQTGDSDDVIKQKAEARKRVIESLKVAAGPGASNKAVATADVPVEVSKDGSGEVITPEDRELDAQLKEALASGAGRAELDQLLARYDRPAFTDEAIEPALKARDAGRKIETLITPTGKKEASALGVMSATPVGSYFVGAGDAVTLGGMDEAAGVLGGDTGQARLALDASRSENPMSSFAGSLTGGALLPIGRGATTIRELAGVGGALGAAYGVGSGTDTESRTVGGVAGGLTGAALGASFGKLSDLARARFGGGGPGSGGGPIRPDTLDDTAARLNITPSPATVGGRGAEAMQIGLGNAPGSMGPVRAGVETETAGLAEAARATAGRMGAVATPQEAGEIISRGARVADRAQARAAGRSYDARTNMMGGDDAPVTMGGTQTAVTNIANDFSSNEVVGELLTHPLIRRLQQADANELTLSESTELLSEARRVLRRARETKQPARLISQVGSLESAIEGDVVRAAQASDAIAGRGQDAGAVAAQRQGDSLWSDRMQAQKQEFKRALSSFTDDVNTSGESVYRQLFNDMREEGGNLVRLRRTLNRLPRRAQETFAASAFDDLGKADPGQQNAAGDAWSFQTFMTNWGKASDEAKRVAFGGRGVDREVSDIVRYADRLRQLDKARNFSNSAETAGKSAYVTAVVSTLLGVGPKEAVAVAGIYPAMNVVGRAFMATPPLRSWLRSTMQAAVRGNNSQIGTLVRRLPSLAAKNPAVSAEVGQMERAILSAMNDNRPMSAAASDDDKQKQR